MIRVHELIRDLYNKGYRVSLEGEVLNPKGQKRSLYKSKKGYYSFTCKDHKGSLAVEVHKFAAYQLFGEEALEKGINVRHVDGCSTNNRLDNLVLGSSSDNSFDRSVEERKSHALKAAKVRRVLTEDQVRSLREDRNNGFTYIQLMDKYNIAKSTVSYIVNNKTYSTVL